jgi:hypothetical protein
MAFGQEIGRALSDGRIVVRAEPFAKVFASSRVVKRTVGLVAWGVLEDIALDAQLDGDGRLVAETSVRAIAVHLVLSKHRHQACGPAARLRVRAARGTPRRRVRPLGDLPLRAGPVGVCRAVHRHPEATVSQELGLGAAATKARAPASAP